MISFLKVGGPRIFSCYGNCSESGWHAAVVCVILKTAWEKTSCPDPNKGISGSYVWLVAKWLLLLLLHQFTNLSAYLSEELWLLRVTPIEAQARLLCVKLQ